MTHEDIKTEADYWEYCTIYSKYIFVREKIGEEGGWGNASLEELPPVRRAFHIKRMLEKGIIPTRLKTPEELGE